MASEILEVTITLDTGEVKKGFVALTEDAKKAGAAAGDGLGGGFSKGQAALVSLNAGIGVIKEGIEAVRIVAEKAFEFAKAGEEISAIEARFGLLAEQAGLVPESIKKGIEAAVGGTVDTTDALQKATESFVELGHNAERLPELFEAARKASQLFGGSTVSRVDQISAAIASGNTRILRQIGLIVNANQVYAEYAKSIGVSVSFLSKEQEQHALLNAVLDKSSEAYKNVNANITPLSESFSKLGVAMQDAREKSEVAFNSVFGSTIKGIIDGITESINGNANALKAQAIPIKDLWTQIAVLNDKLEIAQGRLSNAKTDTQFSVYSRQVADLNNQLEEVNKRVKDLNAPAPVKGDLLSQNATKYAKQTFEQSEILRKLTLDGEQNLSGLIKSNLEERRNDTTVYFSDVANLTRNFNDGMLSEQLRYDAQIKSAEEQFKNLDKGTVEDKKIFYAILLALAEQHKNNIDKVNKQLVKDAKGTSDEAGSVFKSGLVSAISTGISTITTNLMKGKGAFDNFGKVMLGIAGSLATQVGSVLVGIGLGMMALGEINPFAAVAAGIGLIAIGSILSSLSGDGPVTDNAQSSGGGITSTPSNSSNSSLTGQDQRQAPQNNFVFNVEGHVFDSRETGQRMIDIFHETFAQSGATLPAGMVTA